jgi:hypothetical protein
MLVCCSLEGLDEMIFDIVTEEYGKCRFQFNVYLDEVSMIEFDYLVVVKHSRLLYRFDRMAR